MPDLDFQITGVEPAAQGLAPLLHFKLQVSASPPGQSIQGVLLNVQIQIQAPQRSYSPPEKERLFELFGPPEQWGQTLRNRLWGHAHANQGAFTGSTLLILPVPCSFDLNIAATKYFYALETGEVPLLFLFSGSLFYTTAEGRLQVERISWSKECVYRMPLESWRSLMDAHYPNCAWLYLQRDTFERVYAYKRRHGLANWDQTILQLLPAEGAPDGEPNGPAPIGASLRPLEVPA